MNYKQAEELLPHLPPHRWYKKSLDFLVNQKINKDNVSGIPLNPRLLESLRENGFQSPWMVMENWYPLCGSQRLRCAMELTEEQRKNTVVSVLKFDNSIWLPFYFWANKKEGSRCTHIYMQMIETIFKTLYMRHDDGSGTPMTVFENEGNELHWDVRDGNEKQP